MENQKQAFTSTYRPFCPDFGSNGKHRGSEVNASYRETYISRSGELQVTGTAEVCCPADKAFLRIRVTSSKESIGAVTISVSRRMEYIMQALRQHSVREEDTLVRRFLHQENDQFHMDAEVVVTFSDFEKMEQIRCILLEKLDNTVCVWAPQFYHSPECLSQMRQKACVSAVENAQQKANTITQLLGQSLGTPRLVREDETKECKNEVEDGARRGGPGFLPHIPTITTSSQVSVFFGLRGRGQKQV